MARPNSIQLTRRDMLKLSSAGAGVFALTASGFAVPRGFAGGGGGGGSVYLEAFPTSPLILKPFYDELVVPEPMKPVDPKDVANWDSSPRQEKQDSHDTDSTTSYTKRWGPTLGTHQMWPSTTPL